MDVNELVEKAIPQILSELDPHSVYISAKDVATANDDLKGSFFCIGIEFTIREDTIHVQNVIADGPAERGGVIAGDKIVSVDGKPFVGKVVKNQEAMHRLKGEKGTKVTIGVLSYGNKKEKQITLVRDEIKTKSITASYMLNSNTGYIKVKNFGENTYAELLVALASLSQDNLQNLVIDLRDNTGGYMQTAVQMANEFLPAKRLITYMEGRKSPRKDFKSDGRGSYQHIPLCVLINEGSASASEIFAGAIQDNDRGTVIGRRSFGKGLVQQQISFPDGSMIRLTIARYYTPSGRCVQALDYSHRNEDGSVGAIPDSLTHEFKTAGGRTVRDGGGITPDVKLKDVNYSRLTYSLVLNGIVEQYALRYVMNHESIPAVDDFHFGDKDYEDFIDFAKTKEFDYRSSARTLFDQMKRELEKDGLKDNMGDELAALEKALEMDKETFLKLKKDEVIPFIEEEIAVRYYFQEAGVRIRTRYDEQLKEAMKAELIKL